jgi:hypothetical protein
LTGKLSQIEDILTGTQNVPGLDDKLAQKQNTLMGTQNVPGLDDKLSQIEDILTGTQDFPGLDARLAQKQNTLMGTQNVPGLDDKLSQLKRTCYTNTFMERVDRWENLPRPQPTPTQHVFRSRKNLANFTAVPYEREQSDEIRAVTSNFTVITDSLRERIIREVPPLSFISNDQAYGNILRTRFNTEINSKPVCNIDQLNMCTVLYAHPESGDAYCAKYSSDSQPWSTENAFLKCKVPSDICLVDVSLPLTSEQTGA